ncbi:Jouberin [Ooceraea biroi]|uniref:Jouberin n=1 Tax=Ooceraea biroi TaxID=2015173 RepID=A0A026VWM4_OOCBI|nr:Jouberin [Ooceraea biroi]
MAKPVESTRDRRLRRSRDVPSFFEESTESVTPLKTTMNVVADVHDESGKLDRRQRDDASDLAVEFDDKAAKRSSEESKASSGASEGPPRSRSIKRRSFAKDRRSKESHDDRTADLIEELELPTKSSESLDEKPRQRRQWNTASVAKGMRDSKARTRRKRWAKDTSVIRLPGTSDDLGSPLIDEPRRPPIPMPRSSVRRNALPFDNPAFTSENDDEVLRIETDHNKESTKIEIRRMRDRASVKDVEEAGTTSWRKNRGKVATTSERLVDSDDRSSKARSSESRENSVEKIDSSTSLEKVTDVRSSSITSEERPSSRTREKTFQREGSLRKRGRPLHRKEKPSGEVSSSARDASSAFEADAGARKKKKRQRKQKDGQRNGKERKEEEEMKHISVTIHRADVLEADYVNVKRPMVKVHIVDARSEGCWNKIAWAFLKPIGVNGTLHTEKKVRLQLYRPRQSFKRYGKHKCEVYSWWQSNNRDKYPSSLLVTITSVSPRKSEPVIYQQLPLDDFLDDTRSVSRGPSTRTSESIGLPKWARLAAQSCKVPNEIMFETETSENGCFYVAFSNDGKYLACVHSEEYNYPIIIYEVETGKIHVRFLGHKTFVYSLNWSSNDHHLLSASADQTARIWDVRNQIIQHIEMLPHPSYVYCAKYGPEKGTIVATGCYDQVARIWTSDRKSKKRELSQELEGHEGFVNSVVFQKNGNLITADSVGSIILWTVRRNSRMPSKREWCMSRKIKIREIDGVVINTIALHPLESRLLVHSRDNGLRLVDLATGVVLQKYKQLNNRRYAGNTFLQYLPETHLFCFENLASHIKRKPPMDVCHGSSDHPVDVL